MKLIALFPAILLLAVAAPVEAKTISLKCTSSELRIETGYEHDGTKKDETKTSNYPPNFLNINLAAMRASVDGSQYTVTATPEKITLVKGSVGSATMSNPFKRFIINRNSLKFEEVELAFGGYVGSFRSEAKGSCIKSVVPVGNQI